jgi:hypothetical protein
MVQYLSALIALLPPSAVAFPSIARTVGVEMRAARGDDGLGQSFDPVAHIDRRGAAPINSQYPYNGATNGLPSQGKG